VRPDDVARASYYRRDAIEQEVFYYRPNAASAEAIEVVVKRKEPPPYTGDPRSDLVIGAERDDVEKIHDLIKAGFQANVPNAEGETAIMRAVKCRNARSLQALVELGADPNATPPKGGERPLIAAVRDKNETAVRLLLEHGADVNITLSDGTPLLIRAVDSENVKILRMILAKKPKVNVTESVYGTTALDDAAAIGWQEMVKDLLEAGADPNLKARDGRTAVTFSPYRANIIEILADAGANVNARDKYGVTTLMRALDGGLTEPSARAVVIALIKAGADVNARNNLGETALSIALASGVDNSIIRLLTEAGAVR
jgi:ankyrin repeat protein